MICGFEEYLVETKSIYDLIANCFGVLCSNIRNQEAFVGEYMSKGSGAINNPNLDRLKHFSQKIREIMKEYEASDYDKTKAQILEAIEGLEIENYLDEKKNHLTVIYCILVAIDSKAMEWSTRWMQPKLGPLDENGKTGYRVYFSPRDTLHEQFVDGVKRKRVGPSNFFECFTNFRFVKEKSWEKDIAVPQIQYVSLPAYVKKEFKEVRKLKIAVIPCCRERHFDFVPTRGAGLKVEYLSEVQEKIGERICDHIEKSIDQGAHIIILPEYTTSPVISKMIKKCLRKMQFEKSESSKLLLVFAGTMWTEDDNNVMQILDVYGRVLGEYYKYSAFTKGKEEGYSFEQTESLSDPGKRCDLIGLEGIGVILPAVCRDVIDGVYTEEVAKMLLPVLVAIAAWSPSVASFEPRLEDYANKHFTSAVLCNACSSVNAKSRKIGAGSIVAKKGSIAKAELKSIDRTNCQLHCKSMTCVYFLEYDFSFEADVKNTQLTCDRYGT